MRCWMNYVYFIAIYCRHKTFECGEKNDSTRMNGRLIHVPTNRPKICSNLSNQAKIEAKTLFQTLHRIVFVDVKCVVDRDDKFIAKIWYIYVYYAYTYIYINPCLFPFHLRYIWICIIELYTPKLFGTRPFAHRTFEKYCLFASVDSCQMH